MELLEHTAHGGFIDIVLRGGALPCRVGRSPSDVGHRPRPGHDRGAKQEGKQLYFWHRISPMVIIHGWGLVRRPRVPAVAALSDRGTAGAVTVCGSRMRSVPPFYGMGSIAFALSRRDGGFACVVVNVRLRLSQALPKAQISRLRRSLVTTFEVSFGQP